VSDGTATALADALRDRYVLERELGRGGMATVFLARDVKHKRPVAFKVLHPQLAASLGPERFEREIEFAARLQHPHILTVLDSGETAGQLWFTMPFVEGESLRDRLRRERQLGVEDAVRITREAAQALQYAHEHGVVHRDIKPENLLLTKDGNTLVADFGIARALSGDEHLTQTGMAIGTPAYMSPEQATADKALDARTDIYSLACVLYEMLAGEPPFTGPTVQAITAKRLSGAVPSVRQVRPSVTLALDQTVQRALAPVPADRFSSMAEFARALEPSHLPETVLTPVVRRRGPALKLAALGVAFLLALGVLFAWRWTHRSAEAAGSTRLAVLPFENLGPPADEYFADGVADAVRGKLAALPALLVTASNSSTQYKHTSKSAQQVGQELGVQYLLVGKVRWDKGQSGQSRVEVSPELVQVATASTKWQEPFDAALTDVFQVQADIAGRVAQALDVALGAGERERLARKPTANLVAYDLYLHGNEVASGFDLMPGADLRRAAGFYEQAIALDSTFALAWAQLSRAHSFLYYNAASAASDARARQAADRALAFAPGVAETHLALGDYYNFVRKDWARALAEYAAGRKLAPSNAELLKGVALVTRSQGRWEESQAALQQAQSLDPRSVATARRLAHTLLLLRRYPEALAMADRALALAPRTPNPYETKAMVFLARGDLPGARAVLDAAQREVDPTALAAVMATIWDLFWVLDGAQQQLVLRLSPAQFGDSRLEWGLALAGTAALQGDTARARAYADSARAAGESDVHEAPEEGVLHALLGTALGYLGRKTEAAREGERAVALLPVTKDAYLGPYIQHQLVRIYLLVGEPEKALDQLEPLLKMPYYLSPGWLRIDPTFAPLKGNPRFERLVAGK
jgi:TolB-like protein/tRNA A-37 threonylcarbamoyl transferase component Bud32/Tfp pilus assembly protein PilF